MITCFEAGAVKPWKARPKDSTGQFVPQRIRTRDVDLRTAAAGDDSELRLSVKRCDDLPTTLSLTNSNQSTQCKPSDPKSTHAHERISETGPISISCHTRLHASAPLYTINLMWINKSQNLKQETIFPDSNRNEFIKRAFSWVKTNPGVSINIWYDSTLISAQAVTNTTESFRKILCSSKDRKSQGDDQNSEIILRDIRTIELVQSNPEIVAPEQNVFFRVDLLRLIGGCLSLS